MWTRSWCFLPLTGPEAVEAVAAPVFRQFDDGMAVGFAFGLPREVERFAAFEPRTDVQRVGKVGAGGGEGFVGFFPPRGFWNRVW